jgi:monothiol glutaredoxin
MIENKSFALIRSEIENNDVVLFIKGTADFPQCGFSSLVVNMFKKLAVPFKAINVLASDELRQAIKDFSNWPTIPQIYVKKEFIGGCDIAKEMFESGELKSLLIEKGLLQRD